MCKPTGNGNSEKANELLKDEAKSPRHAIELAMKLNAELGHENYGSLSFSHGFAPQLTPPSQLPLEFRKWDELGEKLPYLWSSGKLRSFIDTDFPMLDASLLPPEFALRAAHILGITIHAYWHVGGLRSPDGGVELVPANLERPWYYLVMNCLQREQPYMGFYEMLIAAFNYPVLTEDTKPKEEHRVSWFNKRKESFGMVEYNPEGVFIDTLKGVVSLSGVMTEKVFFTSFAEMNCRGCTIVTHMINAQEAAAELVEMGFLESDMSFEGSEPHNRLACALSELREELYKFTEGFSKLQNMRKAEKYVDPTVWAEAIAPVDKPFPGVKVGPSGAGMPITIALDAFFRRTEHGNFIGKTVKDQLHLHPVNWRRYIHAIRDSTGVGAIVSKGNDTLLKGLFAGMFHAYAGDSGFLGIHRLKFYGYMEFTKKLARGKIKGFSGILNERIWTKIGFFMEMSMKERHRVPLDAVTAVCQNAKIIPISETIKTGKETSLHVRFNMDDTGIVTAPGDRMGILYESDEGIVKQALLAFANYDGKTLEDVAKTPIKLSRSWRTALRLRPNYQSSLGLKFDEEKGVDIVPHEIPLSEFLRYAKLRPVDENMVRVAYGASLNPLLLKFVETHREAMLQGPDLIHLFCRSHANATKMLLQDKDTNVTTLLEENCEKLFDYADLLKEGFISRKCMARIARAIATTDKAPEEIMRFFDKHDEDRNGKLDYSKFKSLILDTEFRDSTKGLKDLFKTPSLCEMFPPIDFRVYSIASADSVTQGEVQLCVEKVKYLQRDPTALVSPAFCDTEPFQERFGAGSNYLKQCTVSPDENKRNVVVQYYRQPTFQLPPEKKLDVPVIMFAAGSGVAPFRSFWQELAVRHGKAAKAGTQLPAKPLLILQARTRDVVPFASEMASLVGSNVLDVNIWLSREDYKPDFSSGEPLWVPGERGYVHNDILNGGLRKLLESELSIDGKAILYVCSGAGFASNIMDALSDIVGEDGIEDVMSYHRLKLEVFTSTKDNSSLPNIPLSDFLSTNDFKSYNVGKKVRLEMVIKGLVYDMAAFAKRHPGGMEILFLYCGMDASEPWHSVGHDQASEVKSLLDMYLVGRIQTAKDNVELACCTAKLPLNKPNLSTDTQHTTSTSLRQYYLDSWDPFSSLFVESQNIVMLGYMQFWDGMVVLTSAEPAPNDGHMITWEGNTIYKKRKSILQGQMFTATHRKVWNELFPTVFGNEFIHGISALSSQGPISELAKIRTSKEHAGASALVDLLEEYIDDCVDLGDEQDGKVPAPMHALFDAVRVIDENVFADMKVGFAKIIKCFEDFKGDSLSDAVILLDEINLALIDVTDTVSTYCASATTLAKNYFDEDKVNEIMSQLAQNNDAGGLCRVFPLYDDKIEEKKDE